MCGITGIMAFNEIGRMHMIHLAQSTQLLKHRGPDYQNTFIDERVGLGHRRLSVIDPSPQGHQPMSDSSGRYRIVYNGEVYNYKELRRQLQNKGVNFHSESDTEVLLNLFIYQGAACLEHLNGCFAFAIFDSVKNELFLARDRFGINPLLYYHDNDKFVFASEMRSVLAYNIPKALDYESLNLYLELNYVPAPFTMLQGVKKLLPGEYLRINSSEVHPQRYYQIPQNSNTESESTYHHQKTKIVSLMEEAVSKRLVADVPLGAFLSGGIDSSIVVALASRHTDQLSTFSIGYSDQPFFDETNYAQLVANKFRTRHTVYSLNNQELYNHLFEVWDHMDEPFGDSSVLPTYILSKYTRQSVTVALSGDGADELFGGYNKHLALQRSLDGGFGNTLVRALAPLATFFPKSRNNAIGNKMRQLDRMAQGLSLSMPERYWFWAGIATGKQALAALNSESLVNLNQVAVKGRRQQILKRFGSNVNLNDILYTDMQLVLPNDMLCKVDGMSMAHGLEVRVPFLDHELVNYVFSLPAISKVNNGMRKRILQDSFKEVLPTELYNRPKKGFEVPLLDWMRTELNGVIENELLSEHVLKDQGLFDVSYITQLKKKLRSRNPQDSPARVWGLLVFQKWWQKYF
jgi:asparagine synthase (glutamine-hydrolysing)